MFPQVRQKKIVEVLARRQRISLQEIQDLVDASPATIRRDLTDLERRGEVVRVHGGVVHPSFLVGEPSFDRRSREEVLAKEAIAAEAARHVEENASVFIDAGTTCLEVARRLFSRGDVTLITYSVPLLVAARGTKARVLCIGGELREVSKALVGSLAQSWMKNLHMKVAFIGASGLSEKDGASATVLAETAIKREAAERSEKAILLADASKWNRPEAIGFAGWDRFDLWITDDRLPKTALQRIRAAGTKVIAVPAAAPAQRTRPDAATTGPGRRR